MHAGRSRDMTNFIGAFRDYANAPVTGVITFNAIINKLGRAEGKRTRLSLMQDEIVSFYIPLFLAWWRLPYWRLHDTWYMIHYTFSQKYVLYCNWILWIPVLFYKCEVSENCKENLNHVSMNCLKLNKFELRGRDIILNDVSRNKTDNFISVTILQAQDLDIISTLTFMMF